MRSEHSGITMPHGWVENVLMDVIVYCTTNGLDRVADAIGPALMAAKVLNLADVPPAATHDGVPNSTQ